MSSGDEPTLTFDVTGDHEHLLHRRAAAMVAAPRRVKRTLGRRNAFAGEPYRLVVDPTGARHTAETIDVWMAWPRAVAVCEDNGGLVMTFDGGWVVLDIPPWLFPDRPSLRQAHDLITTWLAASSRGRSRLT